jgi:phytoene dehydrogenase-like protein
MADYDALVIGAGHNGLVAAAFLAKAGLTVLTLERQRFVGGMAGTAEYFPGFRHNVGAWCLMASSGTIIDDLELRKHGFEDRQPEYVEAMELPGLHSRSAAAFEEA